MIMGGFPCQDISYAGKGAGLDGERSGLFYELMRIVRVLGPKYVVLENVAALFTRGMDQVLGTLASHGYDAEWEVVSAAPWVRRTDATGCSSSDTWPTPTAHNSKEFGCPAEYTRVTPTLTAQVLDAEKRRKWPTPQATDNRDRGCMEDPSIQRRVAMGKQIMLSQAVKEKRATGTLNPQWVEWLMGFPDGWTDLDA